MDGLAAFEKELEREKERQKSVESNERKRRHHHHSHHRHRREQDSHVRKQDHEQDRQQGSRPSDNRDGHSNSSPGKKRSRSVSKWNDTGDHRHDELRDDQEHGIDLDHQKKRSRHVNRDEFERDGLNNSSSSKDKKGRTDSYPLERDSWMTDPSGVGIDYIQRRARDDRKPPPGDTPRHQISKRELNSEALEQINIGMTLDDLRQPTHPSINYTFGDEGSQWRMAKLKGVFSVAEQSGRSAEEVAIERLGGLREFDDAREESIEMERRRLYGTGYALKNKPTGELYRERMARSSGQEPKEDEEEDKAINSDNGDGNIGEADGESSTQRNPITPVDQTVLNRLRAALMKAKLRGAPDVAELEKEYSQAVAAFAQRSGNGAMERTVVLDASHSRLLAGTRAEVHSVNTKRGRERGLVEANDDMSIDDMVREERRTKGTPGGEALRLAEKISKDAKYDNDLEYLDENVERFAKRTYKSESTLKDIAVHEYTKMNKILESCPLCHHEDRNPPQNLPLAPVVSLATRCFLTLSTEPELTGAEGGAVIVPIDHHTNLLECNDDVWEEIRNFMKSLLRFYHDQGRDVIFYENAAAPHRRMHAALVAVPIPYELGDTAPAFFREAMLSADEEWSQHKKIIDTGKRAREGLGRSAFRKSIAKEMPYFHAWFTLDGGLGHIVEDGNRWPKGDLFARGVIGGMLDVDASIVNRQGRWIRSDPRLDDFRKRWRKFDWTRILRES